MRTLAMWLLTKKVPQRFPPPPGLDWPEDGTFLQDGGGRAALVPARRSGPRAAYLHTRARSHRGRREGYSQDEVTVRCAARAAVALPAEAALAVRLSPAPDELRRMRYRERDPGRLLGESGRRRVQQLRSGRLAGSLARRHRGDRSAASTSTRGSAGRRSGGTFDTRRTHRHHRRLRVLRELQAPHSA